MQSANLTCPSCKHIQQVEIPQTGCLAFHKCLKCQKLISVPKESSNCCVICEYSDKKCPVPHKSTAVRNNLSQILLWIFASLVVFVVASIFGWKALYGVVIPKAQNLSSFTTLGILTFAFIAGFVANFGPCSLGVLPAYMSFYLGIDEIEDKRSQTKKSIRLGLIASLGVFSFFIVLGLLFATVGTFLTAYASQLKMVVALFILLIGIIFLRGGSINLPLIDAFRNKVNKMSRGRSQAASLFGFGIVYAAGGLMCFLPIFLPLIFFPLVGGEFIVSILSFLIFSFAQALFLIAVTIFIGRGKQTFFKKMIGKATTMKKVAGGMLVLTSIWMFAIFFIWGM